MLYKSNLRNPDETWTTEEVSLVPCEDFTKSSNWDSYFLCPDWNDEHVMFANYQYSQTAWIRLLLQRCDSDERAKLNKTCKSEDEIDEYFAKNVFHVKAQ
jgi:hypothetical protein